MEDRFVKVARIVKVPMVMGYFKYPGKTIGRHKVFHTSDKLLQHMA